MSKKKRSKHTDHSREGLSMRPSHSNRTANTLIGRLEGHFSTNNRFYFLLIITASLMFSLASFDQKVSIANDDANYIEAGASYAQNFFGYYYNFQGTLYPMVLGLVIKLFGVNIFILKLLSVLFFTGALSILYLTFSRRIPLVVLVPGLFLTAVNFQMIEYASLTFSECFFLFIISIVFHFVLKISDRLESRNQFYILIYGILIGFGALLISLTRSIGVVSIVVFFLFFLFRRRYLVSGISVFSFVTLYFLYNVIVQRIWHIDSSQFSSQAKTLLQKDAYNPRLGQETLKGFVLRFYDNAQIYISSRLMFVFGFGNEANATNLFLTLVVILLILLTVYFILKDKKHDLLLPTLFFIILSGATFIALQTYWAQTRLIMIYLPFILFTFFYFFYHLQKKYSAFSFFYVTILGFLVVVYLARSATQVAKKLPVLVENIQGNPYAGYTEDWQNYLRMSEWCKENLPEKDLVATRKAPISFIFTRGRKFYGIYSVQTENADSLLTPLRLANVNYLLLAELRLDPSQYSENEFITTMHRYAYYISNTYPGSLKLVHQEGVMEKAQLYKIDYEVIDSIRESRRPG